MRIQHNIMAMNAYRNYNANTSALSKNLEKLSSGYRINRAGDDAAGLAISEKMRAQITGLEAAQKNVKDGISLVKTAEGAMQEVQDMLNRMVYLSEQSANGTYDNEVDRANLQKEVDQLRSEIDRIADSSNFNGIKLLDGSMEKGAVRGAEYTKVEASEIEKQIKKDGVFGTTQGTVENQKTILEADGMAASKPSFSISLDGLTGVDSDNIQLKINGGADNVGLKFAVAKDDTASDLAKKFVEANKGQVTLTDAAGVTTTFDVVADGNSIQFKGTEVIDFTAARDVTFVLDNGLDVNDPPEVHAKETELTATPYKVTGNVAANGTLGGNGASIENVDSVQLGAALGTGADGTNGIRAFANENGLTGDVTVQFDKDGKAGLYIGDTKIAEATAALTASIASDGSATITFNAISTNDFKNSGNFNSAALTITVNAGSAGAIAADAFKSTDAENPIKFTTGVSIAEDPDNAGTGKFVPDTTANAGMAETLKDPSILGLDGEATGNVTIKYDSDEDKWTLNVDNKPAVELDADATTAAGTITFTTKDGGLAVGKFEMKKADGTTAAATLTEADFQNAFGGAGMIVASLGHDLAVNGHINGAIQNIQDGSTGAANQLANTTLNLAEKFFQQDGNKITIGDTTYTVALGADSKFKDAKNVIDLTDMSVKDGTFNKAVAATRLTTVAKENNGIFSIGHDNNGNTTIQQLASAKESTDMSTVEKFASYITIEEAKPGSLDNVTTAQGLTLQIGDTSDSFNQLAVSIEDMHCSALGIADIDISTQSGAQAAVNVIRDAINQVSSVRGTLGATQNRLEHTQNNLSVMAENIQDAESTIRDTDVASEMMAYTKNNILIQSAQAMLAQANAVPQGVLQLLG